MTRAIELSQLGSNITVDDSGRVGIATDTPHTTRKLTLHGTSNYEAGVMLMQSSANIFSLMAEGGTGHVYYDTVGVTASNLGDHIFRVKNGTEGLRIKSDGNVGIGTDDPNQKLEVLNGAIRASSSNATQGTTIIEGRYSHPNVLNILGSLHSSGSTYLSYGLRASTTTEGYVSSFSNFSGGRSVLEIRATGLRFSTAPAQNTAIRTAVSTDIKFLVENNGNVGIGTDTAGAKLHIYPDASSDTVPGLKIARDWGSISGHMVQFDGNPTSGGDGNVLLVRGGGTRSDTETFEVRNGGGTTLVVKGSGNVGIGTNDPSTNLEVYNGNIKLGYSSGAYIGWRYSTSDNNPYNKIVNIYNTLDANVGLNIVGGMYTSGQTVPIIRLRNRGDGNGGAYGYDALTVLNSGRVGIGTNNPITKFFVKEGSSSIGFAEYNNGATIWLDGADGDITGGDYFNISANNSQQLTFGYAGGESVRISSDGNVGINTSNPQTKLHISGTNNSNIGTNNDNMVLRFEDTDPSSGSGGQMMGSIEWYGNDTSSWAAGVRALIQTYGTAGSQAGYLRYKAYQHQFYAGNDGLVSGHTINALTIEETGELRLDGTTRGIRGGFGGVTTNGTTDWNDSTNARSGNGYTLLLGTASNGPGPTSYFHAFSFEYSTKNGSGNMTQLAIGYNSTSMYIRYRYSGVWSSWAQL